MAKAKSVIFVCLGNICRSPLAEGVAKEFAKKNNLDIKIASAGTGNWHIGEPPCDNSIEVAKINGIDISNQRAQQINKILIDEFDLIVALDDKNITDLKKMGAKPLKLGDYGYDGDDVPDPYFFPGFEGFDKVFEMIKICVENLLKQKI
jgi:protein-tyrosine phosphatase